MTDTKKTAKKAAPKKKNPVEEFAAAVEKARKAGVQLHATVAYTDENGNETERSF